MASTDLSALPIPAGCREWVLAADPVTQIRNHPVTVDLDWWNTSLSERGLAGGPVTGIAADGRTVDTGRCNITRGHVFDLSPQASTDPVAAQRLLWHALAWGSGLKYRLNHQRMNSIAADAARLSDALVTAAGQAADDPIAAYRSLYPNDSTLITGLGPAFLTKYLYFAGQSDTAQPSLILDSRVAASLVRLGWTSLHPGGAWPAVTYERYLGLVNRWVEEMAPDRNNPPRADLVERWLFDHHPADVPADE